MKLMNIVKHFKLITHHKWVVFKLCCKVGEPWRGFMHDISKYSPTEFWEGCKYYVGTHSPITEAKKQMGIQKLGYIIKEETNIILNIGKMTEHQKKHQ